MSPWRQRGRGFSEPKPHGQLESAIQPPRAHDAEIGVVDVRERGVPVLVVEHVEHIESGVDGGGLADGDDLGQAQVPLLKAVHAETVAGCGALSKLVEVPRHDGLESCGIEGEPAGRRAPIGEREAAHSAGVQPPEVTHLVGPPDTQEAEGRILSLADVER